MRMLICSYDYLSLMKLLVSNILSYDSAGSIVIILFKKYIVCFSFDNESYTCKNGDNSLDTDMDQLTCIRHSGKSVTIRESNHASGVYKEHYA